MPITTSQAKATFDVAATASNLNGGTVRDDYSEYIARRLRTDANAFPLVNLIERRQAKNETIQDLREGGLPGSQFTDRNSISTAARPLTEGDMDLDGPRQPIKVISGVIQSDFLARSVAESQGLPYGDSFAEKTDKLTLSALHLWEKSLITGDAEENPLSFNGLIKQMTVEGVDNIHSADSQTDSVLMKLRRLAIRMTQDPVDNFVPSVLITDGDGYQLIEEEVHSQSSYTLPLRELVPGFHVSAIMTGAGEIPIVISRHLFDPTTTTVPFIMLDRNHFSWRGLFPAGGARDYNPQIFDFSPYTADGDAAMLQKRLLILAGTPYLAYPQAAFRLDVTVPAGSKTTI